jgi:predicted transcriptional regulator
MENTMIQIGKETATLLKEMKTFTRQTYDDVIRELIAEKQHETLTKKELKEIEESLNEIKAEKIYSIEDVAKELGVKL